MDVSLRIDVTKVIRKLDRVAAQLAPRRRNPHLEGAHRAAGAQYLGFIRRRFRSASAGDGTWRRLAPSTVRQKGAPVPILKETGRLYNSLLPGNPDCIFEPIADGIRVGSRVPYLGYHQFGTGDIPRRAVFVGPDDATLKRMRAPYQKAFKAAIEAGLRG